MNLNKVIIIGRITNEITVRMTPTNQSVASFSVATNRNWIDKAGAKQEEVEFHNVVVWGRQAEICSQFLTKGSLVMIEGRLKTRSWQAQDGSNRKATEIIAERVQFGPKSATTGGYKSSSNEESFSPQPSNNANDSLGSLEEDIPQIDFGGEEIKTEDLPF